MRANRSRTAFLHNCNSRNPQSLRNQAWEQGLGLELELELEEVLALVELEEALALVLDLEASWTPLSQAWRNRGFPHQSQHPNLSWLAIHPR